MRPHIREYVNVIDNETMRSVCKGRLVSYTRTQIVVESLNSKLKYMFDAKYHHFEGYKPKVLLIRK